MPQSTKVKSRNWTDEQDSLLKEVVLEAMRNGTTQLEAFEIVAEQTNRTPGSVGFRWNNTVRKTASKEIEIIKRGQKRNTNQKHNNKNKHKTHNDDTPTKQPSIEELAAAMLTYQDVINFLLSKQDNEKDYKALSDKHKLLQDKYDTLEKNFNEIKRVFTNIEEA
ncbi:hypothetical protein [Bacillus toyonensis]|uniref:hypothetical protein n=1 Tax=Bacillus toyonensis TaxID=155322 RepID=UPI002E1F7DA9|nr:hypothetical protein [Bacillus toyonensis]